MKSLGHCGLDCSKCETYIATIKNDDEKRKEVAALWSKLNNCEIPYQAINCLGCKQEGIKCLFCDSMCEVRKCALNKGIELCNSCNEFESCPKVKPFLESKINAFNK